MFSQFFSEHSIHRISYFSFFLYPLPFLFVLWLWLSVLLLSVLWLWLYVYCRIITPPSHPLRARQEGGAPGDQRPTHAHQVPAAAGLLAGLFWHHTGTTAPTTLTQSNSPVKSTLAVKL